MYNSLHLDKTQQSQPSTPEPQPTTEQTTQTPPPASTITPHSTNGPAADFVDADDYLNAFGGNDFPDTPLDETGAPMLDDAMPAMAPSREPLPEKEAWDNTAVLMDLRETAQGYGLSLWVDGTFKNAEQYFYQPEEKKRLIKAWSRVVGHYHVRVSPWVDVIFTEAVCTGPMLAVAFQARKYRMENERLKAEIRQQQQQGQPEAESRTISSRNDTKTQWKVDENGYFEYTESNTYIPKKSRRMKPDLSPENYGLLCKHNGKQYIDDVFKITAQ